MSKYSKRLKTSPFPQGSPHPFHELPSSCVLSALIKQYLVVVPSSFKLWGFFVQRYSQIPSSWERRRSTTSGTGWGGAILREEVGEEDHRVGEEGRFEDQTEPIWRSALFAKCPCPSYSYQKSWASKYKVNTAKLPTDDLKVPSRVMNVKSNCKVLKYFSFLSLSA